MDWSFVFIVTIGWVVSGGLMYTVYGLGKSLCAETFSGEEMGNQSGLPLWRQGLNGIVSVGLTVPIFGYFFDDRGLNVDIWDHLLGIFFAVAIAFSVGWHDAYVRRKPQ